MSNEVSENSVPLLSLKQIADWQNITPDMSSPVIARVPALQRGAVWKPGQVELLWDSILRGFPIGAFVVCKKLESQTSRPGKYDRSMGEDEDKVTHHLLDGQQRANAIALGFDDPFSGAPGVSAALWLDLEPDGIQNTTRSFLFRITTEAHPWGYAKNDEANRISASQIRAALQDFGWRNEGGEILRDGRPRPSESWPKDANKPIPFAWLMRDLDENRLNDAKVFWASIRNRCETHAEGSSEKHWARKAIAFLEDGSETAERQKNTILSGLRHALALRIVVLNVSKEALMAATPQESANAHQTNSEDSSKEKIAHAEHLFQRLNAGGTPLGGEELAYSLIKAYWPDVEEPIEKLVAKRMPASRLMMLGARAALTDISQPPKSLQSTISVSTLRRIALENDEKNRQNKERIRGFFLPKESDQTELESVLKVIDAWLGNVNDDIGLPAVLHTSIARNSSDIYLLLMWLARRALVPKKSNSVVAIDNTAKLRRLILGLATALHWFGVDKSRAVAAVYGKLKEEPLRAEVFRGLLKDIYNLSEGRIGLHRIPTPKILASLITLPTDEATLKDWHWWNLAREPGPDRQEKPEYPTLQRLKEERELLIYAQRAYMKRQFGDYDPARQDLWEQHNRPWDYDHILASAKVYYQPDIFAGVKAWVYCIANLRAWPMEDNRSDQAAPLIGAKGKLKDNLDDSFIEDTERDGFQEGYEGIRVPSNALIFISSARNRLLRIYREWYDTLEIGVLTGE